MPYIYTQGHVTLRISGAPFRTLIQIMTPLYNELMYVVSFLKILDQRGTSRERDLLTLFCFMSEYLSFKV